MSNQAESVAKHARLESQRSNWRYLTVLLIFSIVVASVVLAIALNSRPKNSNPAAAELPLQTQQSETEPEKEMTAAQQLLKTTNDPNACAITLENGTSADSVEPVLETTGSLYQNLPILKKEGEVFAGWYENPESAANYDQNSRINGSEIVECNAQERTLYASWKSEQENIDTGTQVPILMYHQFTTKPEGEDNWLSANYVYIDDFSSHLNYISEQGFYLPTWSELSAFVDGDLYLPQKSVIITDDDADPTWVELAAPLAEQYQIPVTSFVIGIDGPGPDLSQFVWKRSHTYDMHSAGENGQGRMVNWSAEEIAADLEKSAEVVGAKEIVAYPYGHNNETAKEGLRLAGFDLARTVDQGYVSIGTDRYELPCIRINYGMGVDSLAQAIG